MNIEVRGIDDLFRKLGNVEQIQNELRPWAERTGKLAKAETDYTQTNPPRRQGQTYIRTGALMRGWRDSVEIGGNSITVRRQNSITSYGPFVMGRNNQTSFFAGRWPTDESIERKIAPAVISDLERTIQGALDK